MYDIMGNAPQWADSDMFTLYREDLKTPIKAMYVVHPRTGKKIVLPGYRKLFTKKELVALGYDIEYPDTDYYKRHGLCGYPKDVMREFLQVL